MKYLIYFIIGIYCILKINGHVAIIYPPSRTFVDFAWEAQSAVTRTCGGYNTRGDATSVFAGSKLTVSWQLGRPHSGFGFKIELIDGTTVTELGANPDITGTSLEITIPDQTCTNCRLRLTNRDLDYKLNFRSCSDIDIIANPSSITCPTGCNGHGTCNGNGACTCDDGWKGRHCGNRAECKVDTDCGPTNGKCDAEKGWCYCKSGWVGLDCATQSKLAISSDKSTYNYFSNEEYNTHRVWWKTIATDGQPDKIEVIMEGKTDGWVAIGWRPSSMAKPAHPMRFLDIVYGLVDTSGNVRVVDAYTGNHQATPRADKRYTASLKPEGYNFTGFQEATGSDDIIDYIGAQSNGWTTIMFQRVLTTGDSISDHDLNPLESYFLAWAISLASTSTTNDKITPTLKTTENIGNKNYFKHNGFNYHGGEFQKSNSPQRGYTSQILANVGFGLNRIQELGNEIALHWSVDGKNIKFGIECRKVDGWCALATGNFAVVAFMKNGVADVTEYTFNNETDTINGIVSWANLTVANPQVITSIVGTPAISNWRKYAFTRVAQDAQVNLDPKILRTWQWGAGDVVNNEGGKNITSNGTASIRFEGSKYGYQFFNKLSNEFTLHWTQTETKIEFAYEISHGGWVAIAIPETPLTMIGSKAFIGYVDPANPTKPEIKIYTLVQKDDKAIIDTGVDMDATSFKDGLSYVIKFERKINGDAEFLYDKVQDMLWAVGADNLLTIAIHKTKSAFQVNWLTGVATADDSIPAIKIIHGVLMFLAWGFFLPIGGLCARAFRAKPKSEGEKPLWWKIHPPFQMMGILLTLAGFIVALVMNEGIQGTFIGHTILGIIIMIGTLGNFFIGGVWRPKHGEPKRHFFEAWHKITAYVILPFGSIQILIGLAILEQTALIIVYAVIFVVYLALAMKYQFSKEKRPFLSVHPELKSVN